MFDRQQDLRTIRRCKRGEEPAFQEILDRYRGPIYNLCYRMARNPEDARDLAQEVFIKVFSLLDRFDEDYAFSSWLFRIATNHCIDHLRRNRLRFLPLEGTAGPDGEEYEIQVPDEGPGPDTVLQRKEALERLQEVIAE
ncbi:MAG TPA: sigma-70 family RNA polymerase sigma factor, partial [Candidatus Krumholzibacteria bacterium]|nr:sigma-70 family RNA polymerase sigma factor [Candidatus Krumholzibacteria bacterium]